MKFVWKLLNKHISISQIVGFFFANLFGMIIILLSYQVYNDILPVFTANDSFMKADYLIINKKIGVGNTFSGRTNSFNEEDKNDLSKQNFAKNVGQFTSTNYKVDAIMGINGQRLLNSEMFFESIPDNFIDIALNEWKYEEGANVVPIIIPRTYINMYNFGFAQTHSMPKISEGLTAMIDFNLYIHTQSGEKQHFIGKVIGFSNRLSSILVPQTFMDWSNKKFGTTNENAPTRLILEVKNPADENIMKYIEKKNYETDADKLDNGKITYFLKLCVYIVMGVGILISILSFYILMLSIYLLVQKNTYKLENLLLIGYSPTKVAQPYQILTLTLNVIVFAFAFIVLIFIRNYYLDTIELLYPQIEYEAILPSALLGICLFIIVTFMNYIIIRNKIIRIWKRKDI